MTDTTPEYTYATVIDAVATAHADHARVMRRHPRPEMPLYARDTYVRINPDGDVWVLRQSAIDDRWEWRPMYQVP